MYNSLKKNNRNMIDKLLEPALKTTCTVKQTFIIREEVVDVVVIVP